MNNVEILLRHGVRCVFVNGVEIGHVTRIETPREPGKNLRVILEFDAESVTERAASEQEWSERRVRSREELVEQWERAVEKAAETAAEVIRTRMQRGMQ